MKEDDVELVCRLRKSPILFIKEMWNIVPQPLKPEHEKIAKSTPLNEYKAEWFDPFQRGKHVTWQQWVSLLAVEKAIRDDAPKRISIASGHGIGKDAFLSWVILWYLFCFEDSQIPCTAPTSNQMYDILWKEIAVWMNRMPQEIRVLYEWQKDHIRMVAKPETWFARARTGKKENPEALAGVHGRKVFLVGDEASGVPDPIYTTAEGALTEQDILFILISNPRRSSGFFYDSHHKDKSNWQTFSFNSEDSPIVDWRYVDRILAKYGKESDEYRIQVAGLFPKEGGIDEENYVPLLLETDIHIVAKEMLGRNKRMGVDPAGSGKNKSEWVVRDSFQAKVVASEDKSTTKGIAQKTLTLMTEWTIKSIMVFLDNFGEGANVSQEMALADKSKIRAVSGDDEPSNKRYLNKRAEMFWRVKEWFRTGGEIIENKELKEQLLALRYTRALSGKIKIISKVDLKKRYGVSDIGKADALSLTFYDSIEIALSQKKYHEEPYEPEADWER